MIDMHSPAPPVQTAYDRIAEEYDQQVAGDGWMRERLWQRYATLFRPGDRVLDVACGTGIDAVYLAQRGIRVTAIDLSPAMIDRCRARAHDAHLDGLVEAFVLDQSAIVQLEDGFDGIISAFAGLNTLPDLDRFARDAARLLVPNGRLVVHMLNRVSLWEQIMLLAHRRWRDAGSLGHDGKRVFEIGGVPVAHTLYFPRTAYQDYFAQEFRLDRAYALGVLRPPHDVRWVPRICTRVLGAIEARWGAHRPMLNRGRFFVLELSRRGTDDTHG